MIFLFWLHFLPQTNNEPLNCHNANWIPLTSAPERSTQTQGQMNDGRGRSGRNGRRERWRRAEQRAVPVGGGGRRMRMIQWLVGRKVKDENVGRWWHRWERAGWQVQENLERGGRKCEHKRRVGKEQEDSCSKFLTCERSCCCFHQSRSYHLHWRQKPEDCFFLSSLKVV